MRALRSGPGVARSLAIVAVFAAVIPSCGSPEGPGPASTRDSISDSSEPDDPTSPSPAPTATTPQLEVGDLAVVGELRARHLQPVVEPTAMVDRPGDDRLWITERIGYLNVVDRGNRTRVLDLSAEVSTNGERGLLGIDFSPDGAFMYLSFTDLDGDNRVVEYAMNGDSIDQGSRRDVLRAPHPYTAHHGGGLAFGPDGMLYVGWGDGEAPESDHENAQSLDSLFGKILRIDPRGGDRAAGDAYAIPPDNPFVDTKGARPEIYVLGVRNPWRFAFDRATGDLWIGDVGQYQQEEITRLDAGRIAGANLGWPFFEGDDARASGAPSDVVGPVVSYGHGDRCAVIGGYVYRGAAIPSLRGAYVYGDLCDNRVRAIRVEAGEIVQERDFGALFDEGLAGFGEDADGELYLLSLPDGLFRLEGDT